MQSDGYYEENPNDGYYTNDPNMSAYATENVPASDLTIDNSGVTTENSTVNSGVDSRNLYSQDGAENYSPTNYSEGNIQYDQSVQNVQQQQQQQRTSEKVPNYLLSDPDDSQSASYPNMNNPTMSNESDFEFSTNS